MASDDDIFGNSDDDEPVVPNSIVHPRSNAQHDEGDIFEDSDSDESNDKKDRNRLKKGRILKRKKVDQHTGKSAKPRKKRVDSKKNIEYSSDEDLGREEKVAANSSEEEDESAATKRNDMKAKQNASNKIPQKQRSNNDDPLSKTLQEMKRIKSKPLTDDEKEKIVNHLVLKMENASTKDEEDLRKGKPALHRLALLEYVEAAVSMNSLHQTLLDSPFLRILQEWIVPSESSDTLPNLSLRTSVYKMLSALPCKLEDIKKSDIAKAVAKLRKHPRESPSNKLILKDLAEKWNRIFYQKSGDTSAQHLGTHLGTNIEASLAHQYRLHCDPEPIERSQDTLISEMEGGPKNSSERARAPVSNGFMFTVGLEALAPTGDVFGSKQGGIVGSNRDKMVKKLSEIANTGKKSNLR